MSIFGKRETADISAQIDKLYKELALQIEVNQELRKENESLKDTALSQQKELARFEKNLRINPLSQLEILRKELYYMTQNSQDLLQDQKDMVKSQMIDHAKEISTDAFELANQLKNHI